MGEQTMHPMEDDPDGQDSVRDVERAAFDRGFQLAARGEQKHAREVLALAAFEILRKDRADGPVNLGALGTWQGDRHHFTEVT